MTPHDLTARARQLAVKLAEYDARSPSHVNKLEAELEAFARSIAQQIAVEYGNHKDTCLCDDDGKLIPISSWECSCGLAVWRGDA